MEQTDSKLIQSRSSRALPLWAGWAVLIVLVLVAVWFSIPTKMTQDPAPLADNPDYSAATSLYESGSFNEAREQYEKALITTDGVVQAAQINLKIAHTFREEGNTIRAIGEYKKIALNEEYPAIIRAYAAQSIGVIAVSEPDAGVRSEVFRDEPFASLLDAVNVPLSNRRLFEFAADIYPLALSEFEVALWWANRLWLGVEGTLQLSEANKKQSRTMVQKSMQRGEADLARLANDTNDSNQASLFAETLRIRALTLGTLAFAEEGSHVDAERAYQDALEAFQRHYPRGEANMRLWYASYLATREGRSDDVRELLHPFYSDQSFVSPEVAALLAGEKNNVLGARQAFQTLARIDPEFKAKLMSLGWTESDFE